MAKISLRAYIHEIDTLIDHGQIDEAIGHCKYILKHFPKHVEIYRLLGKAYLENRRYAEATDILTRILTVVPDDYISQIGMSIIREDEGNLDAAIFHMERSFEVQPSNTAIQEELKRLYGRRDGIEPSKIRLTRSALVRMYARGELLNQAVAEARVAISEDPQRVDIELLLARMLFLSGQKSESARICSKIREKLPYCYEANEILAKFYLDAKQTEEAKIHQQIINALEPYYTYTSENAPSPAQVAENAITLEHLVWSPSQEGTQQPEWAKSIGVDIQPKEEFIPEWMANEPEGDIPPTSGTSSTSDSVPETSNFISEPKDVTDFSNQQIFENENSEDLPDWLAPSLPESEPANHEKQPDWMAEFQDNVIPPPLEKPENLLAPSIPVESDGSLIPNSTPETSGEMPDWLKSLQPDNSSLSSTELTNQEDIPEWMASIIGENEQPTTLSPEVNLQNLDEVSAEKLIKTQLDPNFPKQSTDRSEGETVSEWTPLSGYEISAQTGMQSSGSSVEEKPDFPDWIEKFQITDTENEKQSTQPPVEEIEGMPEWMRTNEPQEIPADQGADENGVIVEMSTQPVGDMGETSLVSQIAQREEVQTESPSVDENADMVSEIDSMDDSDMTAKQSPPFIQQGELPSWLQGLETLQPDTVETSKNENAENEIPDQGQGQGEIPEWLQNIGTPEIEEPQVLEKDETLPTWLQDMDVAESPILKDNDQTPLHGGVPAPEDERNEVIPLQEISEDATVVPAFQTAMSEQPVEIQSMEVAGPENITGNASQTSPDIDESPFASQPEQIAEQIVDEGFEQVVDLGASSGSNEIVSELCPEPVSTAGLIEPTETITSEEISVSTIQKINVGEEYSIITGTDELLSILDHARISLKQNDLPTALEQYSMLIQTGKYLDEVIKDIQDALYDHPVEINLWETLGDAHYKAHHIQDALDAFTKAEELFR